EGNLNKAKELAQAACEAGADCIKFQWVYAHEILHPKTGIVHLPGGDISLYDRFKQLEVSPDFFSDIQNFVHSLGKKFMCSPFGIQSLQELFAIQPDYIKIASPELNHIPLLKEAVRLQSCTKKNLPVILSTGVSTKEDILYALNILAPLKSLSLLHCVTSYPAPPEDYNLALLKLYADEFALPVGVSDHSLSPFTVPLISLVCGGSIIEKHITLSKKTKGLDDPVALEPDDFKRMTDKIRVAETLSQDELLLQLYDEFGKKTVEAVIGTGKKTLAESEKENYGRTNRSIHAVKSIKKGEIIKESDIAVLRTEKILSVGLHPKFFDAIIGKKSAQDICDGEGILWEHLTAE
ncbi:MAG: N-acetylneuraminate synthase family protein, partial [Spirochaetales bacterium]